MDGRDPKVTQKLVSAVEETAKQDSASETRRDGRTDFWKKLFSEIHTYKLTLRNKYVSLLKTHKATYSCARICRGYARNWFVAVVSKYTDLIGNRAASGGNRPTESGEIWLSYIYGV